jgi:hypothetical protein
MAKKDELQIERPTAFLARERQFQLVGTAVLALFVTAGAGGLFGDGPLSRTTAASDGVRIAFDRFARVSSPTTLAISVDARTQDNTPVTIRVRRDFLDRIGLDEVRPEGAQKGYEGDLAIFEVVPRAGGARLELIYEPTGPGVLATDVSVGTGRAPFWQLVYF